MEYNVIKIDVEEYVPKYTLRVDADRDDICGTVIYNCGHPECDFRFDEEDRETDVCPSCGTLRRVCGARKIQGRERCRIHGGNTALGFTNPNYRGKTLSKHLPTRLWESWWSAYTDPDLLDLSREIATLEARQKDLLTRVDKDGSAKRWKELVDTYKRFLKARNKASTGDARSAAKMQEELQNLEEIIARGHADSEVWSEVYDVIERGKRLKEAERRRRTDAMNIITTDQFKTLLGYIINSIKTRVKDDDVKMAIFADLQRLNMDE